MAAWSAKFSREKFDRFSVVATCMSYLSEQTLLKYHCRGIARIFLSLLVERLEHTSQCRRVSRGVRRVRSHPPPRAEKVRLEVTCSTENVN